MSPAAVAIPSPMTERHAESRSLYRDGLKTKPTVEMPKASDIGLPKFADTYDERDYKKKRLALAFRIFAKYGFDDGVAGHITLRVSSLLNRDFKSQTASVQLKLLRLITRYRILSNQAAFGSIPLESHGQQ